MINSVVKIFHENTWWENICVWISTNSRKRGKNSEKCSEGFKCHIPRICIKSTHKKWNQNQSLFELLVPFQWESTAPVPGQFGAFRAKNRNFYFLALKCPKLTKCRQIKTSIGDGLMTAPENFLFSFTWRSKCALSSIREWHGVEQHNWIEMEITVNCC